MLHVECKDNDDTMICNVYIIIIAVEDDDGDVCVYVNMCVCVCECGYTNKHLQVQLLILGVFYFGRHDRFPAVPVERAWVGAIFQSQPKGNRLTAFPKKKRTPFLPSPIPASSLFTNVSFHSNASSKSKQD